VNASQVRAKARMAQKRREEEIEDDEMEGGELNLVPYLDIVTNVMLFLLATVTSGLLLGTINSALPEYAGNAAGLSGTPPPGTEQPIQLVVAVTRPEILMFSLSGQEGTLQAPKLKAQALKQGEEYDYKKLTEVASEIVERHWPGKPVMSTVNGVAKCLDASGAALPETGCRPEKSTEVFLMVDGNVPYKVVIATMDALRLNKDGRTLFPGVIFSSGIQ
jgi:biopolymer transport protein TolR